MWWNRRFSGYVCIISVKSNVSCIFIHSGDKFKLTPTELQMWISCPEKLKQEKVNVKAEKMSLRSSISSLLHKVIDYK